MSEDTLRAADTVLCDDADVTSVSVVSFLSVRSTDMTITTDHDWTTEGITTLPIYLLFYFTNYYYFIIFLLFN